MPFYFHPDIKTYNFQSSFLKQGVVDIYSYLITNKEKLPLKDEFVYFPLTYFSLGGYQIIMQPFLGNNFQLWLGDASQNAIDQTGVFRYLFILKLPYLILDFATAIILMKLFDDNKKKRAVLTLWLLNPFSLALIYIFSNIDIFPVFLTVLSLYFSKINKIMIASLLIGLAAGFKAYPILFIPFLFFYAQGLKQKTLVVVPGLIAFFAVIAPFLKSSGFQQATIASGLTTRIISPTFAIGFSESLIIAMISLGALFFYAFNLENFKFERLPQFYLAALLLIFSSIHFHIQWLLWMIPFIIIIGAIHKRFLASLFVLLTTAIFIPLLYPDHFMGFSLMEPISSYFIPLPTLFQITQRFYDPYAIQSILHSVFLGGSIILIVQMFGGEKNETIE
jgi:hypothetical protein